MQHQVEVIFLSNAGGCGQQHCLARGTHQHPGDPKHGGALTFECSPAEPEQGGQSQVLVTRPSPKEQAGAAGNGARGTWDVRLLCESIHKTNSLWHLEDWMLWSRWLLLSLVYHACAQVGEELKAIPNPVPCFSLLLSLWSCFTS